MPLFRVLKYFLLTAFVATQSVAVTAASTETSPAPAFTLPLLAADGSTGPDASLTDYQGQVIYLDFWASWCTPCRKSLPWANDLYNELKDQGFTVLAINLDEEKDMATEFLQEVPLDFPVLYDGTGSVSPSYQLMGMPTSFIIDRKGHLRAVHTGFNPKSAGEVADAIRAILKEAP